MNIAALRRRGREYLAKAADDESRLDADLLLCALLQQDRSFLLLHEDDEVPEQVEERYGEYLTRRAQGEPLAYILGYRDFWTLRLKVTPDVLIPRQDTELVVETALGFKDRFREADILDLGTGSGAIILALKSSWPRSRWFAVEKSPAALPG